MTIYCPKCNSEHIQSRGTRLTTTGKKTRYQCRNCTNWFQLDDRSDYFSDTKFSARVFTDHDKHNIFVITGCQNDTPINESFMASLNGYCKRRNAKLIIMPIRFKYHEKSIFNCDMDSMIWDSLAIHPKLRLMANLPVNPSIENPLSSLDGLSKGDSLIIPTTTYQMRTMATLGNGGGAILTTTGAISVPNVTETKTGIKSKFNHSFSALVVEIDGDIFHIRHLNADNNNGFYDIDGYQSGEHFTLLTNIEAIVLGDVHVANVSQEVLDATFRNSDNMITKLKPKNIVLHDLLDQQAANHHGCDVFTKYTLHVNKLDNVENELKLTGDFLRDYIPKETNAIIVSSNHNDHLDRFLLEFQTKHNSINNTKLYHKLMFSMLDYIDDHGYKPKSFELWLESYYDSQLPNLVFTSRHNGYRIKDIEISQHGHIGINGARGSSLSYAKLPMKMIVGHSHSPSVFQGAYTVGTSSKLDMSYVVGSASSWLNSHCLIYNNGCRQMIHVINGKWKK